MTRWVLLVPCLTGVACTSLDDDGDGFDILTGDCDETAPEVSPLGVETCDGRDEDCNGIVDDSAVDAPWWHADADGDSWGIAGYDTQACSLPVGYAEQLGDCNDANSEVYPYAPEVCDGLDNDCDSGVDEWSVDATVWYPDLDSDGYGNTQQPWPQCTQPDGTTELGGDCDDLDENVSPAATETCETAYDDDCDGDTNDPDALTCTLWYADLDGDGWPGDKACLCEAEDPWLDVAATDCDDSDASIHPGAEETADWTDEDCDGLALVRVDEGIAVLESADASFGQVVAAAGDANDDGEADIWIGAPNGPGKAFLVLGSLSGTVEATTATLTGSVSNAALGRALASGDLQGDGGSDTLIGATGLGLVYVLYSPTSGLADAQLHTENSADGAGTSVAIGDADGEGSLDAIIGAPGDDASGTDAGSVFVLTTPPTGDLTLDSAAFRLYPGVSSAAAGTSLALADLDGDGIDDIVVGAPNDPTNGSGSGSALVFLGPIVADRGEPEAGLFGEKAGDHLGGHVAAGDANGDGYADILVSAPSTDYLHEDAGIAYLVSGGLEQPAELQVVARICGGAIGDTLTAVALPGDLNGDGIGDVAVGLPGQDDGGDGSGAVLVIFGPVTGNIEPSASDAFLIGTSAGQGVGVSLSGLDDIDGDGVRDLIVGSNAGAAWILGGW